jgi:broad specificity phosphatase PhoE
MRTAFDGSHRRRIHLFRHGDVSYVDDQGNRVADSRAVPLTEWGQEQARQMGDFVKELSFDKAVVSGLPRTVQTAAGVLTHHTLEIETMPAFEEIQANPKREAMNQPLIDVAYAFARAHEPGARYSDGEGFEDFETRVLSGLNQLLADRTWNDLALVAHGGVNKVILGWATGAGLKGFQSMDQNTCCLNIIDVDTHPETGGHVRTLIRGVNFTTYDPAKKDVHLTALEMIATRLQAKKN